MLGYFMLFLSIIVLLILGLFIKKLSKWEPAKYTYEADENRLTVFLRDEKVFETFWKDIYIGRYIFFMDFNKGYVSAGIEAIYFSKSVYEPFCDARILQFPIPEEWLKNTHPKSFVFFTKATPALIETISDYIVYDNLPCFPEVTQVNYLRVDKNYVKKAVDEESSIYNYVSNTFYLTIYYKEKEVFKSSWEGIHIGRFTIVYDDEFGGSVFRQIENLYFSKSIYEPFCDARILQFPIPKPWLENNSPKEFVYFTTVTPKLKNIIDEYVGYDNLPFFPEVTQTNYLRVDDSFSN